MATRKKVSKKAARKTTRKAAKKTAKKTAKRGSAKKKASTKKVSRKKVSRKKKVAKKKSAKKTTRKKASKKKVSRKTAKKKASRKKVTRKKTAKKKSKKKASKKKVSRKKVSKKKTSTKKKTTSRKKKVSKKKKASVKKTPTKKKAAAKKKPTKKKAAKKTSKKKTSTAKTATQADGAPAKKKIVIKNPAKRFAARTALAQPMKPADHVPPRPKRRKKVNNDHLIHGIEPYKAKAGEEYMNDKQLEHFRLILEAWKRELMEEVDRTVHHMQDEASNFPDPNDRATQESEFSLELRTRDRERKLLKKIAQAIARIDEGEYGYCEETGEEIGLKRLEARPVATLCVEAQERREVAERQYRDSDDRYR